MDLIYMDMTNVYNVQIDITDTTCLQTQDVKISQDVPPFLFF